MFQHHWPAGLLLINLITANHIRHDRLRRAGGIIAQMPGITARQAHIALEQRRRFVQHAVRTPAVGTREDGARAITVANASMLNVNQIQRLLPAHPHKLVLPAHALWAFWRGEEALTHHRVTYPSFAVHLIAHGSLQGVGERRIKRSARRDDVFTIGFDQYGSPVGGGQNSFGGR